MGSIEKYGCRCIYIICNNKEEGRGNEFEGEWRAQEREMEMTVLMHEIL